MNRHRPASRGGRTSWLGRHRRLAVVLVIASMLVLILAIVVVATINYPDGDAPDGYVGAIVEVIVGLPVLVSAIAGGQILHRHGWIVGLLFGLGFCIFPIWGAAVASQHGISAAIGVPMMVLGGIGYYVIGYLANYPMPFGANSWMGRFVEPFRKGRSS